MYCQLSACYTLVSLPVTSKKYCTHKKCQWIQSCSNFITGFPSVTITGSLVCPCLCSYIDVCQCNSIITLHSTVQLSNHYSDSLLTLSWKGGAWRIAPGVDQSNSQKSWTLARQLQTAEVKSTLAFIRINRLLQYVQSNCSSQQRLYYFNITQFLTCVWLARGQSAECTLSLKSLKE